MLFLTMDGDIETHRIFGPRCLVRIMLRAEPVWRAMYILIRRKVNQFDTGRHPDVSSLVNNYRFIGVLALIFHPKDNRNHPHDSNDDTALRLALYSRSNK